MRAKLLALAFFGVLALVQADLYMHNPPGSNDRNRERSDNRNNANLLFNSQNNAQGGYPWRGDATSRAAPDPLTYYTGSHLRLEWTNQHSCGPNNNVRCELVVQYTCDDLMPGLRDGYPDSDNVVESDNQNAGYKKRAFSGQAGQNSDGTNTIPENQFAGDAANRNAFYYQGANGGIEFPMHEGIDYYDTCKTTQRNKGLYAADQQINLNDARGTRQEPNQNRHGLECPEERDYYPYWRPARWIDAVVLTSDASWCPFYKQNSQNVKPYGSCLCGPTCLAQNQNLAPWSKTQCNATGGIWTEDTTLTKLNLGAPDCIQHDFGRDNHLGNTMPVADNQADPKSVQPETQHYDWTLPSFMAGKQCVVRMRYNISTADFINHAFVGGDQGIEMNSTRNCPNGQITADQRKGNPSTQDVNDPKAHCAGLLKGDVVPLFNRPYVDVFKDQGSKLSIALNTDQSSRTFQDRSYVFKVANAPSGGKIWNLNVRGRRGNIVQCYPAVEYDFVPSRLAITEGDLVHIQIHGSDFNAAKNANNGEGWQYSDRSNLVQVKSQGGNFPLPVDKITMFKNPAIAKRFALLDQDKIQNQCTDHYNGENGNEQNDITNCGKLNRAPNRFPPDPKDGLVSFKASDQPYYYVSTRNNNFSNRSQKGQIIVSPSGLTAAQVAGIVVGTLAGVGLVAGGVLFYGKRHPNSPAGSCYGRMSNCFTRTPKDTSMSTSPTVATTSMPMGADREYRRY